MKCFVVHDLKSGLYHTPFFQRSAAEALRGWETAVNDGNSIMAKFPDDFVLLEIGNFDDESGCFDAHVSQVNLGRARDVVRRVEDPPMLKEMNRK